MEDDDISQALGTITTMVSSESKKLSKQLFMYYAMEMSIPCPLKVGCTVWGNFYHNFHNFVD